jgi:hypothetical protein
MRQSELLKNSIIKKKIKKNIIKKKTQFQSG